MQRDLVYLKDILESGKLALQYVEGRSFEDYQFDVQLQDSVVRRLGIVGEAARRVSRGFRAKYQNISWRKIIELRNVMIHEYDDLDSMLVWDAIQIELPKLLSDVKAILDEFNLE